MREDEIDRERRRQPGESHLSWQVRVAQLDTDLRDKSGPIITAETEKQAEYRDVFVRHVETDTLARTKVNSTKSPFMAMYNAGTIDKDQYAASLEIAQIAELIQSSVSVRGASLEARVDCSAGNRDLLVESLSVVRQQIAYGMWRDGLPMPRRMFLDMIVDQRPLVDTARRYKTNWRTARRKLIQQLDRWLNIVDNVVRRIDADDVRAAHRRVGGGVLVGVDDA